MKRITVLVEFKDERDVFYAGEARMVEDDKAAYFAVNGWATIDGEEVQAESAPENVTLDVQSSVIGTGDSNG